MDFRQKKTFLTAFLWSQVNFFMKKQLFLGTRYRRPAYFSLPDHPLTQLFTFQTIKVEFFFVRQELIIKMNSKCDYA